MTKSLKDSHKADKEFIFWVRNFYGFISFGPILLGVYFLGCHEKCLHVSPEYTPWELDLAYIPTLNRDQRSILGTFEFRKFVLFWVLVKAAVFLGCQINALYF